MHQAHSLFHSRADAMCSACVQFTVFIHLYDILYLKYLTIYNLIMNFHPDIIIIQLHLHLRCHC